MQIMVNIYLFWGAWQDLRTRKIGNLYLWFGGVTGLVYKCIGIIKGTEFFIDWILAMIPGLIFLLIAKVTKEKIGFGDGWVLLILSNFIHLTEVWYVLQTAVFLVMIFSLVLLCSKKVSREYQIPFLPFLWGAQTFLWGLVYV